MGLDAWVKLLTAKFGGKVTHFETSRPLVCGMIWQNKLCRASSDETEKVGLIKNNDLHGLSL